MNVGQGRAGHLGRLPANARESERARSTGRARLNPDLALPGGVFLRYAGMALPTQ